MSDDSDSFIREVSEEIRQDRLFAMWKKYGPYALGGVAAIVVAASVWTWTEAERQRAAEARAARFLALTERSVEQTTALVETVDGPATALAQLRLAAAEAEAGATGDAVETYRGVGRLGGLSPAITDQARLAAARLEAETGASPELLFELGDLAAEGRPYRFLALELRAALLLNQGDTDAAHEDLRTILASGLVTPGLQTRALALLEASGGQVAGQ
ncbi:MAG: hypothetical protein ACFBSD_15570 [Paracoccaceae bacterium]